VEATSSIPSEEDLEQIDWETFYSTGELIRGKKCSVQMSGNTNIAVNMDTAAIAEQNCDGGWKKRLAEIDASIILLFGQQTEPPRSLSRYRNFHINRRKIEK